MVLFGIFFILIMLLLTILIFIFMFTPAMKLLKARMKGAPLLIIWEAGRAHLTTAKRTPEGWWKFKYAGGDHIVKATPDGMVNFNGTQLGVVASGWDTLIPPSAARAMSIISQEGIPIDELRKAIEKGWRAENIEDAVMEDPSLKKLFEPVLIPFALLLDYFSTMSPSDIIKMGAIERQRGIAMKEKSAFNPNLIIPFIILLMGGVIAYKMLVGS
ncbi:MAG: hypothetical protein ACXQS1_02680 [Methermicoccaceae archaeon]